MDGNQKCIAIKNGLIILLCLGGLVLFFLICSRVSMNLFGTESGECLSIAFFGKLELKNVDKIVMQTGEQEIVITDTELIENFVSETAVATHTMSCGCEENISFYLFRGDKCIRSMGWVTGHHRVKVYDADIFHWILTPIGIGKEGFVYFSDDLSSQLKALAQTNY